MTLLRPPERTIWVADDAAEAPDVAIVDQRRLPHALETLTLKTVEDAAQAIETMAVRGAPLIGAAAAYGVALALRAGGGDAALDAAIARLGKTRPTAVNLRWALARMRGALERVAPSDRAAAAYAEAAAICEEDVAMCAAIGDHGLTLLAEIAAAKGGDRVNVLTHCNAGRLACIEWGTATAPIYKARGLGVDVHVWVDETRPRNQGAALTALELGWAGVSHAVIVDNAGGHLMQHGLVDVVITGTDRVTRAGDVANKIGTYLKALAAKDNGVPFHVALPGPTIDWTVRDGVVDIEIEERAPREVTHVQGALDDGTLVEARVAAPGSPARNWGFDVTPARLVTGFITERGRCAADEAGLASLYPEAAG